MMYTLEYQIKKAIDIATNNPEAIVGVFCNWLHAKLVLEELKPDGTIKWSTREFVSRSGAKVRFYQVTGMESLYMQVAGAQFSHVFVRELFDYQMASFVKGRIRTSKVMAERAGYYDEFGVLRHEAY